MSTKTKPALVPVPAVAPEAPQDAAMSEATVPVAPLAAVAPIETPTMVPPAAEASAPIGMQTGMEKAMKTAEEFVAFGQGNAEAFVKSGQIWAAGVQDLSKQFAATAQASFEEAMATFKAMAGAKSVKDAFDLQTSFARTAFEKAVAESSKLTDASFKLTEQTLAPITARMTVAVETFAKAA